MQKPEDKSKVEEELKANNVTRFADGTVLEDLDYDESNCPQMAPRNGDALNYDSDPED